MNHPAPCRVSEGLRVHPGPALLHGIEDGPGLAAHRHLYGEVPDIPLEGLLDAADRLRIRGRGGAAFPFAVKLGTAAEGKRPVIVVNLAEGEPASGKDQALAVFRPHLILDGALATARMLDAVEVHVVLPGERRTVGRAMRSAIGERDDAEHVQIHVADERFIAGQARAALELLAGRTNLPVTAWVPEAIEGHRGRPTLLSNAETWAQIGRLALVDEARYRELGTEDEPGTTLVTIAGESGGHVAEVPFGTPFTALGSVLPLGRPVLIGGFHGAWAPAGALVDARVSIDELAARGTPLAAGALIAAPSCPVTFTARIVAYLAGQGASRCGPCVNGLPALAEAMQEVAYRRADPVRVEELAELITGRGACAHPDGTARLARSMLTAFPDELIVHRTGSCGWNADPVAS